MKYYQACCLPKRAKKRFYNSEQMKIGNDREFGIGMCLRTNQTLNVYSI